MCKSSLAFLVSGYVRKKYIEDFEIDIKEEQVDLGIFIHTGKTDPTIETYSANKDLIEIYSGEKMLNLILYSNL